MLADDPSQSQVEVTTRQRWVTTQADGVTIRGLTMRHAANDAETGALGNQDHSHWSIQDSALLDAHGAPISIGGGADIQVIGNQIAQGGQNGINSGPATRVTIQNNEIHDNNIAGFNPDWGAGGVKVWNQADLVVDGNDVWGNDGPGLWCDGFCRGVVISGNRVHNNRSGILFEISQTAENFRNAVWDNGAFGIELSTSANASVYANTVAWNGNGILVVSDERSQRVVPAGDLIHDNVIVVGPIKNSDRGPSYALAWLQAGRGTLFDAASNNHGDGNAYWFEQSVGSPQFGWNHRTYQDASDFAATPGGTRGRLMSTDEKDRVLDGQGIPTQPRTRR